MKVTVNTPAANRISINNQQRTTVKTVGIGSSSGGAGGATSLSQLSDVDTSGKDNNEALIYDEAAGKFIIKPIPVVDGGSF